MKIQSLQEEIRKMKSRRGHYESSTFSRLLESCLVDLSGQTVFKVAGTNGKGSVTRILSQILIEDGYKVGSFYSPHLLDWRERIQINHEFVPLSVVSSVYEKYLKRKRAFEEENRELSFFENMLFLALNVFCATQVDCIVLEAGLGALRDASYSIHSDVSVLTNVGSDHAHILGESREEILYEKAGVYHCSRAGLFGDDQSLYQLLKKEREACEVEHLSRDHAKIISNGLEGLQFEWRGESYRTTMKGSHQAHNISLALRTLELSKLETPAPEIIKSALMKLEHPCRLSTLKYKGKTILFDGGHNHEGWETLLEFLEDQKRSYTLALCLRKKKCTPEQLTVFSTKEPDLAFRTSGPFWTKSMAIKLFPEVEYCSSYAQLESAISNSSDDLVVVTGSLIACARIESWLKKKL